MRLIQIKDSRDLTDYIINPTHVKEVKIITPNQNSNTIWCIVIYIDDRIHTINCSSENEKDSILLDITSALESIS